jgi:hypothetical protein
VENHAFGFQKFVRDLQPCNPCSRKSGPNVEWFHATRSLLLADPKLADEFETSELFFYILGFIFAQLL